MLPFLIPIAATIAAKVLPSLVTKLGGKHAGEVAEQVVTTAATVAGVPGSTDPELILERLRANGKAEAELQIKLAEIENRADERVLEDRVSARVRDARLAQSSRGNARAHLMLAFAFLGLSGCVATVFIAELTTTEFGLVTTVSGVLLKMVSDAFAFEFGSSQGSKAKDALIGTFQNHLADVARERAEEVRHQVVTVEKAAPNTTRAGPAAEPEDVAPGDAPTFAERLRAGVI